MKQTLAAVGEVLKGSPVGLAAQTAYPNVHVIGRKRGADVLRPLSPEHPDDETFEGLLIVRPEGRLFFLNAGCAYDVESGSVDVAYVRRMLNLLTSMRRGFKLLLYAFDRSYGEDGKADPERTAFYVPDAYARQLAREHPRYFEWVASIHPYRADCVQALEQAHKDGARAVKWLPASQGIDPASPRCDRFYEAAARLRERMLASAPAEEWR